MYHLPCHYFFHQSQTSRCRVTTRRYPGESTSNSASIQACYRFHQLEMPPCLYTSSPKYFLARFDSRFAIIAEIGRDPWSPRRKRLFEWRYHRTERDSCQNLRLQCEIWSLITSWSPRYTYRSPKRGYNGCTMGRLDERCSCLMVWHCHWWSLCRTANENSFKLWQACWRL